MYQVIECDNCDREHISDKVIEKNLSEEAANQLADELNSKLPYGDDDIIYFKAVSEDHKLYKAPDNSFI